MYSTILYIYIMLCTYIYIIYVCISNTCVHCIFSFFQQHVRRQPAVHFVQPDFLLNLLVNPCVQVLQVASSGPPAAHRAMV